MKIQLRNSLLAVLFFSSLYYSCTTKNVSAVREFNDAAAARNLEAEIEIEARALTDSLFLQNRAYHSGRPPVQNRSLPIKEAMPWLLYDEPIMLYIDDWEYRTDSVMVD